jgi:hypothetical protein
LNAIGFFVVAIDQITALGRNSAAGHQCLLFPKADVQITLKQQKLGSAFGRKEPLENKTRMSAFSRCGASARSDAQLSRQFQLVAQLKAW